jgi:hypothetical protein
VLRRISLALAALVAVASVALPAHADPVKDVQNAVNRAVGGAGTGGGAPPAGARSAVVGYIFISHQTLLGETRPTYTLRGALADNTLWTCHDNWPASGAYTVTCDPVPGTILSWQCDVLHADITGLSATARARTTLDCDGVAPPEAQTAIVGGTAHDFVWSPSSVLVSQFSCTIDGGSLPQSPDYYGGCGDPGLVTPTY